MRGVLIFLGLFLVLLAFFLQKKFGKYYSDTGINLSSSEMKEIDGEFLNLTYGRTRYSLEGDNNEKRLVVFVHGFAGSLIMFESLSKEFQKLGYQTLRYDLFGRGYSACPLRINDEEFFIQQINDILKELDLENKELTLVGGSLGGRIVLDYASKFPEKVELIIGVAPACYLKLPSICDLLFKLPTIVSDFLLAFFGKKIFFGSREDADPKTTEVISFFMDHHTAEFRCLFSTLIDYMSSTVDFEETTIPKLNSLYNSKQKPKILIIGGGMDKEVTVDQLDRFKNELGFAEVEVLENRNHFNLFSEPDTGVNPIVLKHLDWIEN